MSPAWMTAPYSFYREITPLLHTECTCTRAYVHTRKQHGAMIKHKCKEVKSEVA
jgi:hypothetical protein